MTPPRQSGSRPRLLDLFCGAGGAAMGYHRAGFDVVGVDLAPQPRYPFEFHQADALEFDLDGFDAIHASPPCQAFSAMANVTGRGHLHPNLIPQARARLRETGRLYVIENVPGAPLEDAVLICGAAVGLPIVRHRLFETNWPALVPPCSHEPGGTAAGRLVAFRHSGRVAPGRTVPPRREGRDYRASMDVEWMTLKGMRQAIPPRYTELLGAQMLALLARSRVPAQMAE